MSKIKNLDRAQYKSDYDAIVSIVKESYLPNYDFNVCSKEGFNNILAYLCLNDIPHSYHLVNGYGISCITINFGDVVEYSYSFWCEYEEK